MGRIGDSLKGLSEGPLRRLLLRVDWKKVVVVAIAVTAVLMLYHTYRFMTLLGL